MTINLRRTGRRRLFFAGLFAALSAAGCGSSSPTVAEQREAFDSAATYSRSYDRASAAQACEAARRALLSQGYVIGSAGPEQVQGRKHFQPRSDVHIEVELRIVCASEGGGRTGAIAFVNAVQERYALKKSATSASVGVGVLGSVSLPLASSDDSLVRVASETVTAAPFYERFFALVERYLPAAAPRDGGGAQAPAAAASSAASAPAAGEAQQPPATARGG